MVATIDKIRSAVLSAAEIANTHQIVAQVWIKTPVHKTELPRVWVTFREIEKNGGTEMFSSLLNNRGITTRRPTKREVDFKYSRRGAGQFCKNGPDLSILIS